jgi:hypothetical protein
MTENEGWRLAQMMNYSSREATGAILVVLEKLLPAT